MSKLFTFDVFHVKFWSICPFWIVIKTPIKSVKEGSQLPATPLVLHVAAI
jgi:hypothetical protein